MISAGFIEIRLRLKIVFIRRLTRFLSVTFGRTFLGIIKPKRAWFWFAGATRILIVDEEINFLNLFLSKS